MTIGLSMLELPKIDAASVEPKARKELLCFIRQVSEISPSGTEKTFGNFFPKHLPALVSCKLHMDSKKNDDVFI